MNELQMENLMRGLAARLGALLEVVLTSVGFNIVVYGASLYAMHVVRTARTVFDYTVALYIIASALVMAAKGAEMLHRKWNENVAMEVASLKQPGAWYNPSVEVSAKSRGSVKVINILVVALLAGFVIVVSGWRIFADVPLLEALARIVPPLAVAAYAAYAWAQASK